MKAFDYQPEFKKTTLDNGVRVVSEHHPYSRAVSAGVYVDLGTRDEPSNMVGAAHFVEHMVFKGTQSRSAYDIVSELEAVGGDLNAYTTREYTCFHAGVLREHLSLAIDVLSDLMCNAKFDQVDHEKEREVILQEIGMSTDMLEEYIFDIYFEKVFKGHSLGRPILGTPQTLAQIDHNMLKQFYLDRYHGKDMTIAVAGYVDHDQVVELVQKVFQDQQRQSFQAEERKKPPYLPFKEVIERPAEQDHILFALPSASYREKFRFDSYILNAVLGSGMTSRLYQKVREDLGLAYSVYSYLHSFTDSGLLMVYAGTGSDTRQQVMDIIQEELENLKNNGVSQKELEFFRTQVTGSIIIGADDIENRMNSLGVNEMVFGEYRPVDAVVKEIESVSQDSINEYIHKFFDFDQMGMLVMGGEK